MSYIRFDGVNSNTLGLFISGEGTYNSPERDTESMSIPGRNGTLQIDNGRYNNITVSYPAFITGDFDTRSMAVRSWLTGSIGYKRLEDTYHPDEFRLARFAGPIEFEMGFLNLNGKCTVSFDCKPQRFLKSGEFAIPFTTAGSIYNDTSFEARPLIRVYGTTAGTVTIGNTVMQINSIDEWVDIDCDLMDSYKGSTNCNGNVYIPTFPVLSPGSTGVLFDGGITKIEIKPRWWTV